MYNLPIDKTKLARLVRLCFHYNIFPSFLPTISYDEKPAEVIDLFVRLTEECKTWLSIMPQIEVEQFIEKIPSGIRQFIVMDSVSNSLPDLERVAIYYLVAEVQQKLRPLRDSWDGDLDKSEVLKVYPELFDKIDDDGLLSIDNDMKLLDGGIIYRDHILHYHQLLRRNFTSNPNFDFTARFLAYHHKTRSVNLFRIGIDHRRIMPKEFYRQIVEFDTWYGPSFDLAKLDNPRITGLTIVKRNKNSPFNLDNKLDRTEFYWSHRDGIKTLQIEEVSDIDFSFDGYYLNRYTHCERDIHKQVLRHFDGAVKVYLPDEYSGRFNTKMPHEDKCYAKPKVFRVDGTIAIQDWLDITSFFFKSNEMIMEYFDPQEFERVFGQTKNDL